MRDFFIYIWCGDSCARYEINFSICSYAMFFFCIWQYLFDFLSKMQDSNYTFFDVEGPKVILICTTHNGITSHSCYNYTPIVYLLCSFAYCCIPFPIIPKFLTIQSLFLSLIHNFYGLAGTVIYMHQIDLIMAISGAYSVFILSLLFMVKTTGKLLKLHNLCSIHFTC